MIRVIYGFGRRADSEECSQIAETREEIDQAAECQTMARLARFFCSFFALITLWDLKFVCPAWRNAE
jgi:hypothetical protein